MGEEEDTATASEEAGGMAEIEIERETMMPGGHLCAEEEEVGMVVVGRTIRTARTIGAEAPPPRRARKLRINRGVGVG